MFNLIRRISYGVIPRPDRPWEEDATSNAPNTRRKRRLSSVERDATADQDPAFKKSRNSEMLVDNPLENDNDNTPENENPPPSSPLLSPTLPDAAAPSTGVTAAETLEVREVTKGVHDVDLEDYPHPPSSPEDQEGQQATEALAASVPLPDEKAGELDEPEVEVVVPSASTGKSDDSSTTTPSGSGDADGDADGEGDVEQDGKDTAPVVVVVPENKEKEQVGSSTIPATPGSARKSSKKSAV